MKIQILLFLCLQSFVLADDFWLSSPHSTNWGDWGYIDRCPPGKYVTAFKLKTEGSQGRHDDTALNAIALYCNKPGSVSTNYEITSTEGEWGEWGSTQRCVDGMFVGFQLRSEGNQRGGDDTAANNLKMLCSNDRLGWMEGDGMGWGDYTAEQRCGSQQAICAIQTQVEPRQGGGDDTSLNNVEMECCDIDDPATVCNPTDSWEVVTSCTNNGNLNPLRCVYSYRKGVSWAKSSTTETRSETSATKSVGFSVGTSIQGLQSSFETKLGFSRTTGHSWSQQSTNSWEEGKEVTAEFSVPPGKRQVLSQVVGKCGGFDAFTLSFKLDEYSTNGERLTNSFRLLNETTIS